MYPEYRLDRHEASLAQRRGALKVENPRSLDLEQGKRKGPREGALFESFALPGFTANRELCASHEL
jgi:hypothetical protein